MFRFVAVRLMLVSNETLPVPALVEKEKHLMGAKEIRASLIIVFTESDLERNHFRYLMSF